MKKVFSFLSGKNFLLLALFLAVSFLGASAALRSATNPAAARPDAAKPLTLKTLAAHPHDPGAYTQGLLFFDGSLYESTGQYGRSSLRKVEIATGKVLQHIPIKAEYFGEGIERIGDRIYFLTWQEGLCFVFDRETFAFQKSFRFSGEGWGLAYDGTHLILSDGTAVLRFFDPETFDLQKKVTVFDGESLKKGKKIANLNELEMVDGELWANIWKSDRIVRIDPTSGKVLGWIDCSSFVPKEIREQRRDPEMAEKVLNGIAYDPEKSRVYITGKEWPVMYELQLEK